MSCIKVARVCGKCGIGYWRELANHDEVTDLYEAKHVGNCDECFRAAMLKMVGLD